MTAIVDTQTNEFVADGHAPDARYQVKTVSRNPNPLVERWHATLEFEAKTSQQIADGLTAGQTAAALLTSRQKDILTMVAFVVRRTNNPSGIGASITSWNAMTLAQKKTAVFAAADEWRDMRLWAEGNL